MKGTKQKYSVGQYILAEDRNVLYKAKIIKINTIGTVNKYFIHFDQWSRNHDQWIDENKVADINNQLQIDELRKSIAMSISDKKGLALQKNKKKKKNSDYDCDDDATTGNSAGNSASDSAGDSVGISTQIKRKRTDDCNDNSDDIDTNETNNGDSVNDNDNDDGVVIVTKKKRGRKASTKNLNQDSNTIENEILTTKTKRRLAEDTSACKTKKEVKALFMDDIVDDDDDYYVNKINIPDTIKKLLVDDHTLITKHPNKLLNLPKKYTVLDIARDYLDHIHSTKAKEFGSYKDLMKAFIIFFNRALPTILLFRQEREQFDAIMKVYDEKKAPATIYGAEHIARFYVRLPKLMNRGSMLKEKENIIIGNLNDFIKFIGRHSSKYLDVREYEETIKAMESMKNLEPTTVN